MLECYEKLTVGGNKFQTLMTRSTKQNICRTLLEHCDFYTTGG